MVFSAIVWVEIPEIFPYVIYFLLELAAVEFVKFIIKLPISPCGLVVGCPTRLIEKSCMHNGRSIKRKVMMKDYFITKEYVICRHESQKYHRWSC